MTQPDPARVSPAREWSALALVLAAAAWLQHAALRSPFFADDFLFLDQVRGRGLFEVLRSPDPIGNFLRPVSRQIHFWWFARLGHETPGPFHAANLALFLVALVLLYRIARHAAGVFAATLTVSLVALHYSVDVPLRWASGSQDLLALTLALAAILLHLDGRRIAAAVSYGLALLCKETVLLAPLVALVLEPVSASAAIRVAPHRGPERTARRGSPRPAGAPAGRADAGIFRVLGQRLSHLAPMLVALAIWAMLWLATRSMRPAAAATLSADPRLVPAALAHFFQTLAGLEWGTEGWMSGWKAPPWGPTLLAAAAVWISHGDKTAASSRGDPPRSRHRIPGLEPGVLWAFCGLLPVAAVAPIWSAYYYLFALCGAALAIGALCARAPERLARIVPFAAIVLAATLSARASAREEFAMAPGAWTTQSHVTRFYVERSTRLVAGLLDQLRRAHPKFPPRSTLFFGGVPANLGWQVGDGPLIRWAYRDSSLRSYFIADFSRAHAERGPTYFFDVVGGRLTELWAGRSPYEELALNLLLDDRLAGSRDALAFQLASRQAEPHDRYLMVWLNLANGDQGSAMRRLAELGMSTDMNPVPEARAILETFNQHGDTLRATTQIREGLRHHPFDPGAHALLADLLLAARLESSEGIIEAFAARVLAPDRPSMWRRWAQLQLLTMRYRQASASLDRYFELAGAEARDDTEAVRWRDELRRARPGGELAQKSLRMDLRAPH